MDERVALVIHATWGFPQTLLGAAGAFAFGRRNNRYLFRSALVTEWKIARGLSLGPFIFVPQRSPRRLVVHEYGHSIQALILGPLYIPIILIPSLLWAGLPVLERRRGRRGISYYAFFTEHWANKLAEHYCHEPSMR